MKKTKWFYCKHCGTRWKEKYLAELCFDTDIKNLEINENVILQKSNFKKKNK